MIEIKENWDERHGMAWVEAWENGFKINDEFFTVGHGASVDNRGNAHSILSERIRASRPFAHIKSFWNGLVYDGRDTEDASVEEYRRSEGRAMGWGGE